jgi:1-acyl-sn-glycerol-3-phosphate acyltransferase
VRLAAKIFCNKIIVNKPSLLKTDGPLLIAANHPNSFLDAVILDILFKKPVWSLARGDVFKKPLYIRLLTKLKILPVYRIREGVENLDTNYKTFDACKEIFSNNGVVLIFSEGLCINEWHLRPLKKGTARLALSAWQDGIDVKVLPVGINYSSFTKFGKNVFINFGEIITSSSINLTDADGKKNQGFNNSLEKQLQQLVYEIPKNDFLQQKEKLSVELPSFIKALLIIPAIAGYILNAPFYLPVKKFAKNRTKGTDHYDSVVTALLTFLYPVYLFIASAVLLLLGCSWPGLLVFIVLPFTAWALVKLKGKF